VSRASWIPVVVAVLGVQIALLLLYQRVEHGRVAKEVPVALEARSEPGPDLVVERADGSRLTLGARSDRYQLVHFWATWCPPCVKEIPSLGRLAGRDPSRLRVWAVSEDRGWADVEQFFEGSIPGHVVRDPEGGAARAYSVRQLPDTYLVDPGGQVVRRFASRQEWDTHEMRGILRHLTEENGVLPTPPR